MKKLLRRHYPLYLDLQEEIKIFFFEIANENNTNFQPGEIIIISKFI